MMFLDTADMGLSNIFVPLQIRPIQMLTLHDATIYTPHPSPLHVPCPPPPVPLVEALPLLTPTVSMVPLCGGEFSL